MRVAWLIAGCICGTILLAGGCGSFVSDRAPGPNEIWIVKGEFVPNTITVPVGTTVTWINHEQKQHTVTSDIDLFNATLNPGGSFSYTFREKGMFVYYDEFDESHRETEGMVYVE